MKRKLIIVILGLLIVNLLGFSKNDYRVERKILGSADKSGMTNTIRFEVKDAGGELVYSVDVPVDYDLPYPAGYVFEDGSLAVVWSYDASVDLFGRNGSLIKKHFMLGKNNIEYERSLMAAADGEIIVLALSDPNLSHSKVQVISSNAELLNEWNSKYKNVTGIAFDNESEIIVLSGYNFNNSKFEFTSSFLNPAGISLGIVDKAFRKGQFDFDGLFIAHDNNCAFQVSTDSFQILEEFKAGENKTILDSNSDRDNLIVAVAAKPRLTNGAWLYNDLRIVRIKDNIIQLRQNVSPNPFREAVLISLPSGLKLNLDGAFFSLD